MNWSLKKKEFVCFFIASILGVLSHFVYDWSNENAVVGLFFPFNESTWEHLKLIFFPIMFVSLVEYFYIHSSQKDSFICIKLYSALLAMALTIVLFYTYSGILGKNSDVLNILIYFISMASAYVFSFKKLNTKKQYFYAPKTCYIGFAVLTLLFIVFSIFPPSIGLFQSPLQ